MARDEFNNVEITNDKQLLRKEFGKTQKFEFSSQKENKTPEDELNEKYLGKTIKKVTEVNVDYVNKVQTHATQTVVASSSSAVSAASVTASAVVAASTVAVVAIATVTGISVVLHDYSCELTSLFITSDSLTYQMSIIDNKRDDGADYQKYNDDLEPRGLYKGKAGLPDNEEEPMYDEPNSIYDNKRPFVLKISNASYSSEHYLDYGLSDYGYFSGLTLGDRYSITLSENRFGGEVLYEESFVTYKNSLMREFFISGAADYKEGTFEVYLDFLNESEDLSDFVLTLIDQEDSNLKYDFPLEIKEGYQEVSIFSQDQNASDFDFERTYDYKFTYQKNDDVYEFSTGSVSFFNTSTMESEIYGVNWDKTANFLERTISFSLSFVDDYEKYSDFKFLLQLNDATMYMEPIEFELDKTTDLQTVSLMDFPDFDFSRSYNYMFTYMEEGNDMEQIIDSGVVTMSDNSGAISDVNGVNWDKTANFITKQFDIQLDYQDDFNYFSDFELELADHEYPDEVRETFSLNKTTDVQTVTITDDSSVNFRRTYDYIFRYQNRGVNEIIESGEVTFTDNSGGQKEFKNFTISPTPNLDDNTFDVQLDYIDDYDEMESFKLTMSYPGETDIEIYLDKTLDVQTIPAKTDYYQINFNRTYNYSLTYWDYEKEDYVTAASSTISFDMSAAISEFNAFIFDETGNFQNETYVLQLDYIDQLDVFTEFVFTLETADGGYSRTINLDHTTEPQTQVLNEPGTSADSGASMKDNVFLYSFKYYDARISDYVVLYEQNEFTFQPPIDDIFNGVESPFDFTPESAGSSFMLPIRFDFEDTGNVFTGFEVQIYQNEELLTTLSFEGETYTTEWMYAVLIPDGFEITDVINQTNTEIVINGWSNIEEYPNMSPNITVYRKAVTFTLGQVQEVFGGYIRGEGINLYSTLYLSIFIAGSVSDFECQLLLESYSGNVYEYDLSLSESGFTSIEVSNATGDVIPQEATFEDEFTDHPMKVSIKYRTKTTIIPSGDTPGESPQEVWSDYQTFVLYDSYQFTLSV